MSRTRACAARVWLGGVSERGRGRGEEARSSLSGGDVCRWLLHFCAKLLAGDPLAYSLLADDAPFGPGARSAMTYLRADLYRVQFSKPGSAAAARGARARPPPRGDAPRPALTLRAGEWYVRKFERPYIPVPLSLDNPSFQDALRGQGWHVPTRTGP